MTRKQVSFLLLGTNELVLEAMDRPDLRLRLEHQIWYRLLNWAEFATEQEREDDLRLFNRIDRKPKK